jgi:hypothetical protein
MQIVHSPAPMLRALRRAHSAYKARIMVAQDVRELLWKGGEHRLLERRRTAAARHGDGAEGERRRLPRVGGLEC